jgi:hypothetical protein
MQAVDIHNLNFATDFFWHIEVAQVAKLSLLNMPFAKGCSG